MKRKFTKYPVMAGTDPRDYAISDATTEVNRSNLKNLLTLLRKEGVKVSVNDQYIKFTSNDGAYVTEYYAIDDILSALRSQNVTYTDVVTDPKLLIYSGAKELASCSARSRFDMEWYRGQVHSYDSEYGFLAAGKKRGPQIVRKKYLELSVDATNYVNYALELLQDTPATIIVYKAPYNIFIYADSGYAYDEYEVTKQKLKDILPQLLDYAKSLPSYSRRSGASSDGSIDVYFDI